MELALIFGAKSPNDFLAKGFEAHVEKKLNELLDASTACAIDCSVNRPKVGWVEQTDFIAPNGLSIVINKYRDESYKANTLFMSELAKIKLGCLRDPVNVTPVTDTDQKFLDGDSQVCEEFRWYIADYRLGKYGPPGDKYSTTPRNGSFRDDKVKYRDVSYRDEFRAMLEGHAANQGRSPTIQKTC